MLYSHDRKMARLYSHAAAFLTWKAAILHWPERKIAAIWSSTGMLYWHEQKVWVLKWHQWNVAMLAWPQRKVATSYWPEGKLAGVAIGPRGRNCQQLTGHADHTDPLSTLGFQKFDDLRHFDWNIVKTISVLSHYCHCIGHLFSRAINSQKPMHLKTNSWNWYSDRSLLENENNQCASS